MLRCALRHGEQLASTSDIGGAVFTVGEQPLVPDAMQALGQHMDQEAPHELILGQGHGLVPAGPLDPVILPFEGNAGVAIANARPRLGKMQLKTADVLDGSHVRRAREKSTWLLLEKNSIRNTRLWSASIHGLQRIRAPSKFPAVLGLDRVKHPFAALQPR